MLFVYLPLLSYHNIANLLPLATGHKRRLGLLGAKRTTITVHRSEEVLPRDVIIPPHQSQPQYYSAGSAGQLMRQGTSVSSGEDCDEAGSERSADKQQQLSAVSGLSEGGKTVVDGARY